MTVINYTAPPTCARFMKSDAFFRLIAGPVGSGKTTACLFELLRRACEQHPAPDGYRYTRFAIVRQTLKQLKDTVLKDITSWLEGMATYKVSDSTIYVTIGDVRSEWILIPLDNPEDQRRLLSMQLTGAWMSECIEMDLALTDPLSGRCGRYPGPKLGGCTWKGIIADTNMPSEGSDWHNFMAVNVPPDTQIFIQPGGLTPEAENLEWLNQNPKTLLLPENDPVRLAEGRKYYERLGTPGPTRSMDWIRRYVHAQYGNDPSGTAVYRESFKRHWHVVDDLEPVQGHPLIIGQDFGRDPWSIIGQVDHKGRLLILEEVEAEDIGLELHIQKSLRPSLMQDRYYGRPIAVVGDPAGVAKDSLYEESSFDLLKRHGFMAVPAPTNDIDPRIRSVDSWLLQSRDAGPAILFDAKRCPKLVAAMGGGYRYAKTKDGRRKPLPDKNEYSHPSDALQYLCLGAGGMQGLIFRRLFIMPQRTAPQVPAAAWT
jgi:hypothetical protein